MPDQYDAIIGTGAGGGTLALYLAHAGKRILILERGPFLPQEKLNWDTSAVFLDNRYHTKDVWVDKQLLHPQQAYFVGGQTKVYGAALFRLRAEELVTAYGHLNDDLTSQIPPTPFHSKPYPFPALPNPPLRRRMTELV
jgi:choline dehydrogenase-like flavoprotein